MDQNDYFDRAAPSGVSTTAPTPRRPGSPTDSAHNNPFGDGGESRASYRSSNPNNANPFISPDPSRPASSFGSASAVARFDGAGGQRYFHSRRVRKGEVEKPWTKHSDPKEKWVTILPILGIIVGLGISAFLVWDGIRSVVHHEYCPVLFETWENGFDERIWMKEVQVNGFGNGEFDRSTGGDENIFIEDGRLIIRATLEDDERLRKDYKIDLLKDGTCTNTSPDHCIAYTNTTTGNSSIVPPVKSGRINTRRGAKIKYGKVEVEAKLPAGDWLWPAIWMMPVDDTYGPWPLSGEIDIVESRGNNYTHPQGGNNIMSSALHWGPSPAHDGFWKTNNKRQALHTTYSAGFNTFGLEWSQKYLFTYVNSRLLQVMYVNFDSPMWSRGNFPPQGVNGTKVEDIWGKTGRHNTPFDQPFYLIINLAVGGTNGWFEDNANGKPWLDSSPNARKDFYEAKDRWLPTWTQPQLEVRKVSMWQQCDGDEDL
ncbi:hypothetical protein VTJ83DRAFT_1490 [Remersonia thermophila]|uniref:GH16 domain-containing protein n=1 Tax=Remersonia thermophila TaxID=72144 RepID=A0ABR4DG98_9PEZI